MFAFLDPAFAQGVDLVDYQAAAADSKRVMSMRSATTTASFAIAARLGYVETCDGGAGGDDNREAAVNLLRSMSARANLSELSLDLSGSTSFHPSGMLCGPEDAITLPIKAC